MTDQRTRILRYANSDGTRCLITQPLEEDPDVQEGVLTLESTSLDLFCSVVTEDVVKSVNNSWTYRYPCPEGLYPVDLVAIMVCSKGYTMNPSTFSWGRSTHADFEGLWKLCERLSTQYPSEGIFKGLLRGRSHSGYRNNMKITEPTRYITTMLSDLVDIGAENLYGNKGDGGVEKIAGGELHDTLQSLYISTLQVTAQHFWGLRKRGEKE